MRIDLFKLEEKKFTAVKQIELPFIPTKGNIYQTEDISYKVTEIIFTDNKIAAIIETVDDLYAEIRHTLI